MKKIIIAGAVVVIAAALIVIPQFFAGKKGGASGGQGGMPGAPGGAAVQSVFSVHTAKAEKQTLTSYIEVNGDIAGKNEVAVLPDMAGKLTSVSVSLGSMVRKGQAVATVDPSRPGQAYSTSPVYAPTSGIVLTKPLAVGSTVTTQTTLFTIGISAGIQIEAAIPEREVGQLKKGLTASITLEAFPGETFKATVTQLDPGLDPTSRTKTVYLNFDKDDLRINTGMFASVKLNTRSYPDVLAVPSEAVTTLRNKTGVYVVDANSAVRFVEVETGVTVDDETEIKSGLEAGNNVVIQGQQ
jgi:multidrug efflux pump subunit AcrA (membrane-fusion protein)